MKKRSKLNLPMPKKEGLGEQDIVEISEEVRRFFQEDAALHEYAELKKKLPFEMGPNYRPTVFYTYILSTNS